MRSAPAVPWRVLLPSLPTMTLRLAMGASASFVHIRSQRGFVAATRRKWTTTAISKICTSMHIIAHGAPKVTHLIARNAVAPPGVERACATVATILHVISRAILDLILRLLQRLADRLCS